MEKNKQHIVFKLFVIFIAITLVAPAAIKFAHIFEHNDHIHFTKSDTPNIHECEVDCVLLKYNLQQCNLKSVDYDFNLFSSHTFKVRLLKYNLFRNKGVLCFSLRGPPALA